MPSRLTTALLTALLAALLAVPACAQRSDPEPGVSHALAIARAAQLSEIRYDLEFNVRQHAERIDGTESLAFTSTKAGDLAIDYRDGEVSAVGVNEQPIATKLINGHILVPVRVGRNLVSIRFASKAAPAGKAITRYSDKDDGKEYFYTLFVPMDASMAFPCFDQPDLKARFRLSVDHPAGWTVIANTGPGEDTSGGLDARVTFPETQPISTYLFAFAVGPWARIPGKTQAEPAVFVRQSQLARAQQEAPEVQQMAARGIAYLSSYFQQPFPFPKYDLVLIPGFPFGGMEHAGETFLNEDGVLFRSTPTASDYFHRDILVLHETTHQWFGDLVTMRWFDDLWLKEGFAQYMAYKAMAALEPETNPWKHFYEDIKPLAYAIDETQGTTPIYQNIPNLIDAKSAYGAIVYQKAPAVLKQLNYFLGEENFRDGLRLYLKQHAYANAQWADLVGAFESASDINKQHKDVQTWAKAWILQRGMPQVTVDWSCSEGHLGSFALSQHDVLGAGAEWPIVNEVRFTSGAKSYTRRFEWDTSRVTLDDPQLPCPDYVFANSGDEAYGRFLLDSQSEQAVTADLLADKATDPLLHSQLWGALWENVRVAQSPPRAYAELALRTLPEEADESLNRIQGGRVATALHEYLGRQSRQAVLAPAEQVIADRMLHAPDAGLRIVNFRTFTSIAETPAALRQLKDILTGDVKVPGLKLKPLDRWSLVGHLLQMNDPDAAAVLAHEQATDKSGESQRYNYAFQAGIPTAANKAKYFDQYLKDKTIQEDWLTQSLRPFNAWNQTALTEPYLTRALNELPEIKLHRKIFFLGAWLGAFIDGQNSQQAQTAVHAWLATNSIDPDLRLKVLEVSDALDRTVRIRQRFPE